MAKPHQYDEAGLWASCMRAYGTLAPALAAGLVQLGLSSHMNSDSAADGTCSPDSEGSAVEVQYGLKGITSHGKRTVRNAAHIIENSRPKGFAVFATCTVPSMPLDDLRTIHEGWHHVVERYRLLMKRALQDKGLTGEIVTVSEIQEKRYKKTGIPVLHIHSVFIGKCGHGGWAISTEQHDEIWARSLKASGLRDSPEVSKACNMQRVKKSASSYLGKYMTKGSQIVTEAITAGMQRWFPKQWWSCSLTIIREIKAQTKRVDGVAEWLNEMAGEEGSGIWVWHRDVQIEVFTGDRITMARYGRLTQAATIEIQTHYSP